MGESYLMGSKLELEVIEFMPIPLEQKQSQLCIKVVTEPLQGQVYKTFMERN